MDLSCFISVKYNLREPLLTFALSLCLTDTPLTSEGQRVAAAFEAAGAELQGSEVKLAVIDVTKEKELAKKLNVSSQPTIRLYLAGDINSPASCPGMCV